MALPLRRVVFWLHLTAGCLAGAVILLMSVTGLLLAYEEQIVRWSESGYRSPGPAPGASRLPLAELVTRAADSGAGATPTAVTLEADPRAPVRVAFGRTRTVYVEPSTGRLLGEGAKGVRGTLRQLTEWHRWLGLSEQGRATGRAITGACNLAFLFLVLSGLYLWVPRIWNRLQFRNVLWFRRGLSAKARDFNWHHVFGLWLALPLVAVVASGAVMSYPWASGLLYRAVGEKPPAAGARRPTAMTPAGETRGEARPQPDLALLEPALAVVLEQVSDWRTVTLEIAETAGPVAVTVAGGGRGRPDLRSRWTVDTHDADAAAVVEVERFADQTPGRRLRTWSRWIHTGEAGGIAGQTLAALASAAGAVLVWTGLALAWRRLVPRRKSALSQSGNRGQVPSTDGGL